MRTRVVKWGNSLGLRIPKSFAKEIRVGDGSPVDLKLENGQLVVRVVETPPLTLDELLAGVTDENVHGEVETGDALGGESW